MSEADVVLSSAAPLTRPTLAAQLRDCGLQQGQCILVHSSLRRLGWVAGGPVTVIEALLDVLGATGTLMMPTHTADNTDPANWCAPPVPPAWWPILREHLPAYDPARTPTRGMGCIAEAFRCWPGAVRSHHPIGSFAALGPHAQRLTADHDSLAAMFGEESPIARLYELDGFVLLLGVGHDCNTSLHLAEHRASWPSKCTLREGTAVQVHGIRQWVSFEMLKLETDDFIDLGSAYEAKHGIQPFRVGQAEARLLKQRPMVEFAVQWMNQNRH